MQVRWVTFGNMVAKDPLRDSPALLQGDPWSPFCLALILAPVIRIQTEMPHSSKFSTGFCPPWVGWLMMTEFLLGMLTLVVLTGLNFGSWTSVCARYVAFGDVSKLSHGRRVSAGMLKWPGKKGGVQCHQKPWNLSANRVKKPLLTKWQL